MLIGVYRFRSGSHVIGKYVLAVVLCLYVEIALLADFSKVGGWIDPLQLIVGRDMDNSQMEMLACGSGAGVARYAQLLTCINCIAFLDGDFTKMHILHPRFGSVFTGVFNSDRLTASCRGSMIDTNDHTIVFRGKNTLLVGLDVDAVVYLRLAFVYRVFTLAVRGGDEHELLSLHRHTVACGLDIGVPIC